MRRGIVVALAVVAIASSARPASAQLSPMQAAILCGPPANAEPPGDKALRILGALDSRPRSMFTPNDLLVIAGGTSAGVQLGQEYSVRRSLRFGLPDGAPPHGAMNVAWIRVVAVNQTTAIASALHVCDAIDTSDYLEPFSMPMAPQEAEPNMPAGELDFAVMSRVIGGAQHRDIGAVGDMMVMSSGTDQGVAPGGRFAVYRDVKVGRMPLAAVGEAVVISAAKTESVIRLTQTRDAVQSGDYLVPRK
jgi:hypothetical protein